MVNWGIYTQWDRTAKGLPKLIRRTREVPAEIDIEFGYTLEFKGAKGALISFEMKHPPFCDDRGEVLPDFTGEQIINSNEWRFFLGDTVWAPAEDKCGVWELITYLDDEEVARERFTLFLP